MRRNRKENLSRDNFATHMETRRRIKLVLVHFDTKVFMARSCFSILNQTLLT